jgi:hypothetical protein
MSLSHLAVSQQLRDGFHRAFTIGTNPFSVLGNRERSGSDLVPQVSILQSADGPP